MDTTERLTVLQAALRQGVTRQTIYNWIDRGVRVGQRTVYLDARRVGGHWRIEPEALALFEAELTRLALPAPTQHDRTARQRRHDYEAAEQELTRMKI